MDKAHFSAQILSHVLSKIQLTEAEQKYFVSLLEFKTFPNRRVLLTPGEFCHYQWFVIKGCLRVFYLDEKGVEHNAKFAIENWWAFDIAGFFDLIPAYYGIGSLEPTMVFQLSRENYDLLLERVPAFERFYKLMLQQSFVALQHRMTQSLSLTAEQRYIQFQEKYPGLESRISQKHIASYLGITPVFLSMIRSKELTKQ